ncbi:DUF659 domain-containing protein [Mycena sanguinolenta]|uniref:DUF659 domain-containing protein n=1 Tax=Mycena sanguinolenta TaxID=230812 RepID=A0A8H6Y4H8_9AGAR|nr:DUF659 domain-containing protein [Mycena sanguinolenta]
MHTSETAGIDAELAKDLETPITWIPPLDGRDEDTDEDIVEKASQDLEKILGDERSVTVTDGSIISGDIVDFAELGRIEQGEQRGIEEDIIDVVGGGAPEIWNVEDLMSR